MVRIVERALAIGIKRLCEKGIIAGGERIMPGWHCRGRLEDHCICLDKTSITPAKSQMTDHILISGATEMVSKW